MPLKNKKTWIKICGFTEPDNALACARFSPDAMGLVFFDKSPRNVSVEQAARITEVLPGNILPVGVFVDKPYNEIMDIVERCRLGGVQLHGNEPSEMVDHFLQNDLLVIKALFAKKEPFLDQADRYHTASYLLIEYGKGVLPGGNAESWNYALSRQMKTEVPIVLAGGLGPETICDALKSAGPAGVDVSSGVEKRPGMKDPEKVRAFIEKVKAVT